MTTPIVQARIQQGRWSKEHVMEGIERACTGPLKDRGKEMDALEFGVYRGETTQLIDNTFYGYQYPVRKIFGFDSFEGLPAEDENVERFYLFNKGMFADVGSQLYPLRSNGYYVKCWFNELTPESIKDLDIKPACFVHIDGDLYISAVHALTFLFDNNLIIPGTVIAFDEYKSTSTLEAGGESKAWVEVCDKYKIEAQEFFRNVYFDQIECWQNAFEIKSIGQISSHGVINV